MAAYAVLHELADKLEPGAHVQPQLGFDEWVFGGVAPTVRLQRELWHQGDPHWYDYTAWLVYLSHFVVTLTVAIVLWFVDYAGFRRFRVLDPHRHVRRVPTYVAYPAIPPWLGEHPGRHAAHRARRARRSGRTSGLRGVAAVFGEQSRYAFPVGALPSLHAAWPFMVMLFFWSRAGRWRILLVGVHARDGVHARVHRRPLRVRHPARLALRHDRLRRRPRDLDARSEESESGYPRFAE